MLLRCLGVAVLFSTLLAAADSVTYYGQIAPIVLQDCAPCHRPGESGPFSLLTYADVKKSAAQIVKVIGSRFMPPWLPNPVTENSRRAAPHRRADQTFEEWVKQGTPAGTPRKGADAPQFSDGWLMGQPDLVLARRSPTRCPPMPGRPSGTSSCQCPSRAHDG